MHLTSRKSKRVAEHAAIFYMGWMPKNGKPIQLNGAFYMNTTILCFVMASIAEAELGAFFTIARME
jgi:hypothetical protein